MDETMDILIDEIDVLENLTIRLFEDRKRDGGNYISIKHKENVTDMQGEVLLPPCNVPKLIKALTEASAKLENRSMYFAGHLDGKEETY